jgi:hypothetical protein
MSNDTRPTDDQTQSEGFSTTPAVGPLPPTLIRTRGRYLIQPEVAWREALRPLHLALRWARRGRRKADR